MRSLFGLDMMAPRFARHITVTAPRGLAAAAFAFLTAALMMPPTAQAQRDSGSVTVDLSVLDALGTPQNVPQMLRPAVRSLLMPNAGQNSNTRRGTTRFAPAAPAMPRAATAPASSGLQLKPPSQMKRATAARPAPARAAAPRTVQRPTPPIATPPAPPVIAARPPSAPQAPRVPAVPQSASAPPPPVAPPAASSAAARAPTQLAPPPSAPAIAPPPAPPAAATNAPAAPTQTAALTPSSGPSGKLAAGQQFRLMFGAGTASVEDAAGGRLDDIAKALKTDEALRLQLLAYSGGAEQTPSQARRMSLSRALAVRSRLIKEGVRSTRIDVRALGNKSEGGPPDRVDVIVTTR